jgi:hypothetical protein
MFYNGFNILMLKIKNKYEKNYFNIFLNIKIILKIILHNNNKHTINL